MLVCETPRLRMWRLSEDDAPFVLRLLNEPSFIQNIGDRGVRSLDDARAFLAKGPVASYAQHGFGLFRVDLRDASREGAVETIGINGLLKRDWLASPDVGFAYLPEYWGKGYAYEAAAAAIDWARQTLGVTRVVGIVKPDNVGSMRVLEKLGLKFQRMVMSPEGQVSRLFVPANAPAPPAEQ